MRCPVSNKNDSPYFTVLPRHLRRQIPAVQVVSNLLQRSPCQLNLSHLNSEVVMDPRSPKLHIFLLNVDLRSRVQPSRGEPKSQRSVKWDRERNDDGQGQRVGRQLQVGSSQHHIDQCNQYSNEKPLHYASLEVHHARQEARSILSGRHRGHGRLHPALPP